MLYSIALGMALSEYDFLSAHKTLKGVFNPSCVNEAECIGEVPDTKRTRQIENLQRY